MAKDIKTQASLYPQKKRHLKIKGVPIQIWHFLEVSKAGITAYFLMDRIVLTQTTKRTNPRGVIGYAGRGSGNTTSVSIFHDAPHILRITNHTHEVSAAHLNLDGKILAGSNTNDHGELCLGEAYSLFDWSALNLFCNSRSNKDYEWRGPNLTAHKNKRYSKTNIKEWPIYLDTCIHIPPYLKKLAETW